MAGAGPRLKGHLRAISDKVDSFIQTNPHFQQACADAFRNLDRRGIGRVSCNEVAQSVDFLFDSLQDELYDFGIYLKKPSVEETEQYIKATKTTHQNYIDEEEFKIFYAKVVKMAAANFASGFTKKYGLAVAGGVVAVSVTKRLLGSIPVAGRFLRPLLVLAPAILVGPFLGAAAMYGYDKGDLLAAKKKLFPYKEKQFTRG